MKNVYSRQFPLLIHDMHTEEICLRVYLCQFLSSGCGLGEGVNEQIPAGPLSRDGELNRGSGRLHRIAFLQGLSAQYPGNAGSPAVSFHRFHPWDARRTR